MTQEELYQKALENYPKKEKTNSTGTGTYDANLPRRAAYMKGYVDGYFDCNKETDYEKEL